MGTKEAYEALVLVAKEEGLPVETVIAEIDKVIHIGYNKCISEKDENGIAKWKRIPCEGEIPTALEFVSYMRELVYGDE